MREQGRSERDLMLHLHRNGLFFFQWASNVLLKNTHASQGSNVRHLNFLTCCVWDSLVFFKEKKRKRKRGGGGHITCYSLSLQYEVLPTLPGSMCRRSQRRGGPMELRPQSLPSSPLHFLVPAQHDYVCVRCWGILLAFIHGARGCAAGSRARRAPGTCFVPCQ